MYLQDGAQSSEPVNQNANANLATPSEAGPVHEELEPDQSTISQTRRHATDPIIGRFRLALANIQSNELNRLYGRLPDLDNHSRVAIREFADCLLAKMLHPPLESLRYEYENGSPDYLLNALQRLFRLND